MKRPILVLSVLVLALTGLVFFTNLFSLSANAAQTAPDEPEAINAAPVITNLNPTYGYNDAVTPILISGSNFFTDTAVYLDAIQLTSVTFISSTSLAVDVPSGLTPDTYDVRLVNPDGTEGAWVDGFSVLQPGLPVITAVSPDKGPNNLPVTIDIFGKNFPDGSFASLLPGFISLEGLTFIDSTHLRAVVPQNIATGIYTIEVSTPNEDSVTLPNAYAAFDPALSTDLYAGEYDLWRKPLTIRLGDSLTPTIGLNVRRQGGISDISAVPVDFYLNGPSVGAGGTLIGQSATSPLSPDSFQPTLPLEWQPSASGEVTIFAVIDPADQTVESDETNNVISRTIKVLPPVLGDTVAPVVTGFRINNGAVSTKLRHVVLDTTAEDNVGGSGVESILFAEFAYVQSEGAWRPVRVSGWLTFSEASVNQAATLLPSPGIHYLKVWVADKAGNVSAPRTAVINFRPDNIYIGPGEVHIYRRVLPAGENWQVVLTMLSGAADFYVWDPTNGPVDSRENVTISETIDFTTAQSGIYQLEVEGQIGGWYQLEMIPLAGTGGGQTLDLAGPLAVNGRAHPFALIEDEPGDDDIGLSDPPSTYYSNFLPAVIKE
jgi:hypothetical protein